MEQINFLNEQMNEEKAKRKLHNAVVFKEYNMNQLMLPMNLEDIIPGNHMVKVVNNTIERMNIEPLLERYKGGGTSSFHPKMMLKVLVYAYSEKIFSSRKIAKALAENINFMWISGKNTPDFRTINNFRSDVLKGIIDEVFASVLELLHEGGYIKLDNYFLDGTKIEANANKYTFVWKKSVDKNKAKLLNKVKELLEDIDILNQDEDKALGDTANDGTSKKSLDSKEIDKKVQEIDEKLSNNPKDKKLKKAVRKLENDYLPRCKRYEKHQEIFGDRNSFSKTDEDATFMRMKEDHMKNGQLKAGYNIQIGTEDQFIVGYSVHQRPADPGCMIPHLKKLKKLLRGKMPKNIIADSGYGSEENYSYLEESQLGNYVKYNNFHKDQKKNHKENIFNVDNWFYDIEKDEFVCPAGKKLTYLYTSKYKTDNGYESERRNYECEDCTDCSFKDKCKKSQGNRKIAVSLKLRDLKKKAIENLCSEKGVELRSERGVDVEPVFGHIKDGLGFRRFLLRGLEKVNIEWGLLSIAHNLKKVALR